MQLDISAVRFEAERWIAIAKFDISGVKTSGSAIRIIVCFLLNADGNIDAQFIQLLCRF
jgi:hypothetical protein